MDDSHYVIRPRPPFRALFIAAGATIVGAGLVVLTLVNAWHWVVLALGIIVLIGGIVLFLAGLAATGRGRVAITFTDDGYRLDGAGGGEGGRWETVTRVTQTDDGRQVTIHNGPDERHRLVFAPGSTGQVDELLGDMTRRLDAAKGYTNFN